jgi:hypothetical protein
MKQPINGWEQMTRSATMLFIAVLTVSSLIMVATVHAQSTKPSPPKFTIQIPNNSTIQLVIENQAFTNSSSVNSIGYYFRVKDHNSDLWLESGNYNIQSNSKTTIISIPPLPGMSLYNSILSSPLLNNSTLLDFQVQAQTGYYAVTNVPGPPPLISPAPQQWHTEITFNKSEKSDWSNILTVDLNEETVVTPSPTSTVPAFPATLVFVTSVGIALVVIGLLVYLKKRPRDKSP